MSEHTPGPWTWNERWGFIESHPPYDDEDDSGVLAELSAASNEADARLIAAAPDLLAVLRSGLRHQPRHNGRPSCPFCHEFIDSESTHAPDCPAIAAIAKAEGSAQ